MKRDGMSYCTNAIKFITQIAKLREIALDFPF